jgi:hypothetical protein
MGEFAREGDAVSDAATISALVQNLIGGRLAALPTTDEEWADHDRRIAAERGRSSATEAHDGEVAARKRVALLEAAGCPPKRLDDALTATFRPTEPAVRLLAGFPPSGGGERGGGGIRILSGGVGVGKTVAAVRWLHDHGGVSPLFLRAKALEAAGSYDRSLRALWLSCTAMVLDDLGVEHMDGPGVFLSNLDELLDHFAGSRAPLVVTTNLRSKAFVERYGARIASRLRQLGAWHNVLREEDMREGKR